MSSRNGKKTLNKTADSPALSSTLSSTLSSALDSTGKSQDRSLESAEDQSQAPGENAQESFVLEDGVEKTCYIKGYN